MCISCNHVLYSYYLRNVIAKHIAIVSFDILVSNDSGSSLDSITIVGGAVGGVILLLIITVMLCIMMVSIRRCHIKKRSAVDDNATKLNTDVTTDNPSHNVKTNTTDHLCSTIKAQGSNVPITINPSYNVHTKPTCEDDYNYVQPNEFV